jgi:hypothetical protein
MPSPASGGVWWTRSWRATSRAVSGSHSYDTLACRDEEDDERVPADQPPASVCVLESRRELL